ncbi:MAG: hypothetical protein GOMPHAMPRED_007397 [Gomphillus americanus]|uniref:Exoribonuclease phosphorolytic domain-containing protein n=1 Tax=Gomphillus americanus TaxID=1940652 RepID=A0A8H3ERG5_9LECA|nr:MAG: hypothetical protein GOMPHAMPRED_007397 [Gomphillus americanus]
MTDRRRVNGPTGGTTPVVFDPELVKNFAASVSKPIRTRAARELRKIFLQTGLTPSASGSAYFEVEQHPSHSHGLARSSTLKITCTVHGPRPLPRSSSFTPNMLLTTTVKFAPFAASQRRGYIRDNAERDLAVHLETAIRGVIMNDRWPKSGLDVVITILEGEDDSWWDTGLSTMSSGGQTPFGMMSILSGCITAASTAIVDAGIDCVDIVTGGVAALVKKSELATGNSNLELVLDPCPSEHDEIVACCVVGYLKARDELTEVWMRGDVSLTPQVGVGGQSEVDSLINGAVQAASAYHAVIVSSIKK